ncbi:MAG: methanol--corrinoid methyltransferase [Thermoprotei archaeon]|nr:MAG: methanol--corrinoid methyltransferase [Thermoprotei archaeon]
MFAKMAYESPREMVFGRAKKPLKYGLDLEVGNGEVVPEVKYWPYREHENDEEKLLREYEDITNKLLDRAVNLGMSSLQLETELSFFITLRPRLAEEIVNKQREILEKYHNRYGIRLALRVTPADIRGLRGIDFDKAMSMILETTEAVCRAGADVISVESIGGKEVFDYALIRGDVEGIVLSLAVLAPRDMRRLWREIVRICRRHDVLPGGDTACGFANTAMILAGGMVNRSIPHVMAAMIRAMSISRSLIAYEEGAIGPGKDCAYENVAIKAITGYPMSLEGKTSAVAHSSLVGNIVAAVCDLWSNEQIENIKVFSGTAPQAILEILHYDVKLMNIALRKGEEFILRDLLVESDKFEDPQAFILSPDIAWELGVEVIKQRNIYERTVAVAMKALTLINEAHRNKVIKLSTPEVRYLERLLTLLNVVPKEEDELIDKTISRYKSKIKEFNPSNYDL